jgi:hypothetical protein
MFFGAAAGTRPAANAVCNMAITQRGPQRNSKTKTQKDKNAKLDTSTRRLDETFSQAPHSHRRRQRNNSACGRFAETNDAVPQEESRVPAASNLCSSRLETK